MRISRRRFLKSAMQGVAGSAAVGSLLSAGGCFSSDPPDGKIHLCYWDKWDGIEGDAMRRVVAVFNASQGRIVVDYVPVGVIDRKLLAATAGGDPPDVAGLWAHNVTAFAEQGALTPLDEFMERDGISRDYWIPVYRRICTHKDIMWAVPTTPDTTGLHWNKALFRASARELRDKGLDPEQAPRTLAELDAYADVLTRYDQDGNIVQMGFLPQEPGWFHWAWGSWFGGKLVDEHDHITATGPRNIEAFDWIQGCSRRYGVERINRFASGFGNFASPQNPFFSGKLAMVIHGVWLHNYIRQYAPGMQWGAAPWPRTPPGPEHFSTAGCDVMVIPRGVTGRRREAAWEFVKFVISQKAMEMLNLANRKATPLTRVSEDFLRKHDHPYLSLFIEMSKYKDVAAPLHLGIWSQYQTEIFAAFERVRLLQINAATGRPYTAAEALEITQDRVSLAYARHKKSLSLRPPISRRLS
jgi:multiple sugar transport system substrate-binding protein